MPKVRKRTFPAEEDLRDIPPAPLAPPPAAQGHASGWREDTSSVTHYETMRKLLLSWWDHEKPRNATLIICIPSAVLILGLMGFPRTTAGCGAEAALAVHAVHAPLRQVCERVVGVGRAQCARRERLRRWHVQHCRELAGTGGAGQRFRAALPVAPPSEN